MKAACTGHATEAQFSILNKNQIIFSLSFVIVQCCKDQEMFSMVPTWYHI